MYGTLGIWHGMCVVWYTYLIPVVYGVWGVWYMVYGYVWSELGMVCGFVG